MRFENVIYAKKLLFIRTCAVMDINCIYRKTVLSRMYKFNENIADNVRDVNYSLIFDILRISIIYGLYNDVCRMLCGTVVYSKKEWSNVVWKKAWQIENKTWYDDAILFPDSTLISRMMKYRNYQLRQRNVLHEMGMTYSLLFWENSHLVWNLKICFNSGRSHACMLAKCIVVSLEHETE